jgi:hypothetical protein
MMKRASTRSRATEPRGIGLGSSAAPAVRAYRFTVILPREQAAGSNLAGSSLSVAFGWTAAATGCRRHEPRSSFHNG